MSSLLLFFFLSFLFNPSLPLEWSICQSSTPGSERRWSYLNVPDSDAETVSLLFRALACTFIFMYQSRSQVVHSETRHTHSVCARALSSFQLHLFPLSLKPFPFTLTVSLQEINLFPVKGAHCGYIPVFFTLFLPCWELSPLTSVHVQLPAGNWFFFFSSTQWGSKMWFLPLVCEDQQVETD